MMIVTYALVAQMGNISTPSASLSTNRNRPDFLHESRAAFFSVDRVISEFEPCAVVFKLRRLETRRGRILANHPLVAVAAPSMKPSISCGIEIAPSKYHLRSNALASCLHAVVLG